MLLPTGKPHVSYSEWVDWSKCPHRHRLIHIDRVRPDLIMPALAFGKAIHKGCELYLRNGTTDIPLVLGMISNDYEENKGREEYRWFNENEMKKSLETAASILMDIPDFMAKTFGDWKYISAEENLYESLDSNPGNYFKGFIDGVIEAPGKKKNSTIQWVIDWKSCTWGWPAEKKQDPNVRNQLVLYKTFWSKKRNVPMKDIRAGFVLLKKQASPGSRCELFTVSVGDVSSARAVRSIESMVSALRRGCSIKNRSKCNGCEFKGTVHCP